MPMGDPPDSGYSTELVKGRLIMRFGVIYGKFGCY